jgi:D-serine deaminase-like pyridoxal phosphate-dependent protein
MSTSLIGLNKYELDTPCLVIDKNALKFNLDVMRKHALRTNVHVRPQCKTHKCSQLARMQLEYGAIGISAAKISEAEVLVGKGFLLFW